MNTLAILLAVIVGIAYTSPIKNTGPTGPTPKPVGECRVADTCATFGGWKVGRFAISSDPSLFVACDGSENFQCFRCPRNDRATSVSDEYLLFNEDCDKCVRPNEVCERYVTGTTGTPIPLVSFDRDFCSKPPRNGQLSGNFADSEHSNYYYACNGPSTYHMPCPGPGLVFNATCNECMFPHV